MILKNNGFRVLGSKLGDMNFHARNKYVSTSVYKIPPYVSPRKGGPYTYQKYNIYPINNDTIIKIITTELIRIYTWDHIIK